jgi:NADPH-dependent 2,4-dienoyl-CoA reductase/sulfur reductase-like enzyme
MVIGAEEHAPYRRPPLSKELLAGVTGPEGTDLKEAELDGELRLGQRIARLDNPGRAVVLENGDIVRFDVLLVATGAEPRPLPSAEGLAGVYLLRTLDDGIALRAATEGARHVVVIGAGFIGCEVAASLRERDVGVTVVAPTSLPMPALGERFARHVAELHRDGGVDLRLGRRVDAVEGAGRAERVRLDDGSTVDADVVVVGIGVAPATGWLENTGLDTTNGVLCDESLLAVGGGGAIAVAGDLARWPYRRYSAEPTRVEHWAAAVESAWHAARALVHGPDVAGAYEPDLYFWSMQHAVHIQSVGMPFLGHEVVVVHGSEADRKFAAVVGRDGQAVGAVAFDDQYGFTNICRPAVAGAVAMSELGTG